MSPSLISCVVRAPYGTLLGPVLGAGVTHGVVEGHWCSGIPQPRIQETGDLALTITSSVWLLQTSIFPASQRDVLQRAFQKIRRIFLKPPPSCSHMLSSSVVLTNTFSPIRRQAPRGQGLGLTPLCSLIDVHETITMQPSVHPQSHSPNTLPCPFHKVRHKLRP